MNRAEVSVRTDIAFDPFLSVAIAPSEIDPFVLPTDSDSAQQPNITTALNKPQLQEMSDLNPSQQAIMKMMSRPPRGQDPLGMMAEVQNELHATAATEPHAQRVADDPVALPTARGGEHSELKSAPPQAPQLESSREFVRVANQSEPVQPALKAATTHGVVADNQAVVCDTLRASQLSASISANVAIHSDLSSVGLVQSKAEVFAPKPTGTVTQIAVTSIRSAASDRGVSNKVTNQPQVLESTEVVDAAKVHAQTLRGLAAALRKKGDAVTVILRPESLGKVRIDLRFAESGVRGVLTCSTQSARELLSESVDGLARAMESRGIVVERLEVVHDPKVDPSPGSWDAAGSRQEGQSSRQGDASGTGQDERGGAEFSKNRSDGLGVEVDVIVHDPAFCWDGTRMVLSTLA